MKLFHGTYEKTAPIIKLGEFAMSGNNVFDGLFACLDRDIAASHGNSIFIYHVDDDKIAESRDLNARFQEVYAFLRNELDTADVEEIADRVIWDNDSDIENFADILSPRLDSDISGAYSWELQRLRGRVAAYLGFDAIEMNDEHGTSYLIVNPQIKGE
ncbi:hypothetical protein WDK46_24540 [Escherichia coli]|uniref:Uncharacterized protein n=1 Tax=Escherichia coli (strain SE11) TaxID=409438 RepID=A0A979H5V0_ECOSE|nr:MULTISPECIES: hypothetical protein [Enterobacteriaceae]EEY5704741.1 hypothetical protein [Escherichia coli]MED0366951.1 hypothetical protein [Escherichia marmotae]EFK2453928.1 hypothetical protein [Escherichia coli]EHC0955344.1 hypothetical protein [Escherichia coli]MED9202460.1 hypothetical protein [Escherichia marmotae]